RFYGNYVVGGGEVPALLLIGDVCPGPRCEAHNPGLLPTRDLRLERNLLAAGKKNAVGGPVMMMYYRDVNPTGPAANGMRSRDNVFCAAEGFAPSATPDADVQMFGHREPGQAYALDAYRAQIGDSGSAAFNAASASSAPCPAPGSCRVGVDSGGRARWAVPECSSCTCTLAVDGKEQSVSCDKGEAMVDQGRGRHYIALRVARAGGGRSCGTTYQVSGAATGASCSIDAVDATTLRWASSGTRCRLVVDGGVDIGPVPCAGSDGAPAQVIARGRHRVLLRVEDAPSGQTSCSAMFSP
ncbi:MAG: hypothetical protein KC503_32645, partial [Myxococcales bacterium]|nr:hypothetical protein [Myxococcales bacterium]